MIKPSASRTAIRRGFTMIEILMCLALMMVTLLVAEQNLIAYRNRTNAQSCITNLIRIDSAKRQWALDNRKADTDAVDISSDLVGPSSYLSSMPVCPSGGTYVATSVAALPTCSIGTNGTAATADDHILP